MSDALHIAFAVEGTTDFIVLKEIIGKILNNRDFVATPIQPEISALMKARPGEFGLGWSGVYRWCRQAVEQSEGTISDNPLFAAHDLLIVQLDADVAEKKYSDGHIEDPIPEAPLPCVRPCPPPSATTDHLRNVIAAWLGGDPLPPQMLVCTPSKSLETWILAALFPEDSVIKTGDVECQSNPDNILQSKPKNRRLIASGKKIVKKYEEFAPEIAGQWEFIKEKCTEARRFEADFLSAYQAR